MAEAVVCVKPIPDPKHWDKLSLDPKTGILKREGIPTVINPLDKHALEVALQLKDRFGWGVTVVSMAPPDTAKTLRETLAMGADRAFLASDRALAGADTLATAFTLATLIRKRVESFDLVLCGNMSLDGSTSQVAPQIAEHLDVPHVTHVSEVETENGETFQVAMELLKDTFIVVSHKCPMVLALTKKVNTPRLMNIMGILAAEKKPLEILDVQALNLDLSKVGQTGSPTSVRNLFTPEIKRRREILKGKPEEVVEQLLERLQQIGVL